MLSSGEIPLGAGASIGAEAGGGAFVSFSVSSGACPAAAAPAAELIERTGVDPPAPAPELTLRPPAAASLELAAAASPL